MTESAAAEQVKSTRSALTRYRVMAWAAGVGLLLLLVNMYLHYVLELETVLDLVPRVHGFIYMAYLVTVFDLSFRMKWPLSKGVLVSLAGTVPFLSFVAEHRVTRQTREVLAAS
jgi:integral membrane protein